MSTLVMEPITSSGLEQEFRLTKNTTLGVLRLHLLKNGTPGGNLIIKILEGSTEIFTSTVAMTTLNDVFNQTYGHGVFKFDLNLPLKKSGVYTEYTLQLTAPSYTSSDYYGWVKDWIPKHTNLYGGGSIVEGSTLQDTLKPYHFELYEFEG